MTYNKRNKKYITSMPVLITITVVLAILTILNFVMMLKAMNETSSEVPTSIHTEKEDYIESLVSYFNEQEEMEFMIYLYNNYPEIYYDILSLYEGGVK